MAKIQPTTNVDVDGSIYDVSKMSPDVQQMMVLLDDWRQEEADLTGKILMVRSALKDLQQTLLTTIQAERKAALERAEALGLIPVVNSDTASDAMPAGDAV